ncbi:acyl-CoA oxidase [Saccharomycopsis crataegensis]|uniref:Acyl-coenzyme A oxidase n=1 Tax=Saccharomycopsis crataegensis TaxID=43959 RepID=A0AAV5QJJ7_9ASCO|nr:acyl-CoA oxidase [Saccharomycopsis crataegensis]
MSRVEKNNIPRPYNLIANERANNSDFSVDEMFKFLEGNSDQHANSILEISKLLERDLVLRNKPGYYENTSKDEIRRTTFLKVKQLALYCERIVAEQLANGVPYDKIDISQYNNILFTYAVYDPQTVTRIAIHSGLFYSAIKGNGTKAQFNYWAFEREGLYAKGVYGCFGMTELAHGSNVAALETTAEYDFKTKTFTINTPHIGATKWWIGGAATTANHCCVYARLIVKGKDYGVKTFIVQLRDVDHHLIPGVSIGDIGAKMGRQGIDNGWIQFTNVKIPKNFMLQKYVQINDDEEEVINSPMDQLAYGALLGGRVGMVMDSYRVGAKVTTIALRYAVGRRQFGKAVNKETNFASPQQVDNSLKLEKQLIDYPNHQYRLIPLLATAYCLSSAAYRMVRNLDAVNSALESTQLLKNKKFLFKTIEDLKEVFVISAAVKPSSTWYGAKAIDECRQACGGHGYSAYSSFGQTYNDWVVQCTWEGDNNVLSMNSGRSMTKYRQSALKGRPVPSQFKFLTKSYKPSDFAKLDFSDNARLLELFDFMVISMIDEVVAQLKKYNKDFDKVGPLMLNTAKFFCQRYYLESVLLYFDATEANSSIKPALVNIINLFALYTIKENSGVFLRFGLLSQSQIALVESRIFDDLLPFLRHRIVALTDAFKLSDFFINTPLGNYDGDIYNKYFDLVNSVNNNKSDYDDYAYQDEILKFLKRGSIEEREYHEKDAKTLEKLGK